MDRQVDCHTLVDPGSTSLRRWCGKFPDRAFLLASISIGLSALISLAVLGFAQPVRADAEQAKLVNFNNGQDHYHHSSDAEVVALKEYAQQIGSEQPEHVSISKSPAPHFDDAGLAALHDYAQQAASERSEHASGSAPHYFADPD